MQMEPDFFLFENVKGLWRTTRHREFYEELKKKLIGAGYCISERLTNALEYGVPQDRDRILMFGVKSLLLSQKHQNSTYIADFPWLKFQNYSIEDVKNIRWPDTNRFDPESILECPKDIKPELTVEYWFNRNKVNAHPNAKKFFTPRSGLPRMQSVDEGDVSRKSYKRLHRWRYSPTVAYGNNEVHLHPYKVRRISAAEALALQSLPPGFELPDSMSLSDMFKTIGNGVPFLLANGVANTIYDYMEGSLCKE